MNVRIAIITDIHHGKDAEAKKGGSALALMAEFARFVADPDRGGHGRADYDRRARVASRRGVPLGGQAARRTTVDRELQEEHDSASSYRLTAAARSARRRDSVRH